MHLRYSLLNPFATTQQLNAISAATFPMQVGYAMTRKEAQDLHLLREFDEKFAIPFEVMNLSGMAARELAHGFDALSVGDSHELGFVLAVLAQCLDTERLFDERLDAGFVVVRFVLVGALARGSPAPDTNNDRPFDSRFVHHATF